MKNIPDLPPLWTLACMALTALLAWVAPVFQIDSVGLRWLGLVWILLAVLLVLWAALWFRRKNTAIHPGKNPSALIVEGPYRLSRNPIYLAMVLIALGWALFLGALSGLLPVIILVRTLRDRFIVPEEGRLRETFGAEADAYLEKTRRWV